MKTKYMNMVIFTFFFSSLLAIENLQKQFFFLKI